MRHIDDCAALRGGRRADRRATELGAGRSMASHAVAKDGDQIIAPQSDERAFVGADAICLRGRETGLPIDVYQEFSEDLPFPDAKFDLVFGRSVLHDAEYLPACEEIYRLPKPGRVFLAIREHVISKPERRSPSISGISLDSIRRQIRAVGFPIDHAIFPLETPVNCARQTIATLPAEVAELLVFGVSRLAATVESILRVSGLCALALPVLRHIDRRPDRLYSLVCRRI